jgi:hypothetical protein
MISLFEIAIGTLLFLICGTVFLVSGLTLGGFLQTSSVSSKQDSQRIKTEKESKL